LLVGLRLFRLSISPWGVWIVVVVVVLVVVLIAVLAVVFAVGNLSGASTLSPYITLTPVQKRVTLHP
jgi:hypothetical protein